jgi:hypothetical protein
MAKKPRAPRPAPDGDRGPNAGEPDRQTPSDQVHDAGRPGGLPDLEHKTETEGEHDSWSRHG